jgi:hypothetical protein
MIRNFGFGSTRFPQIQREAFRDLVEVIAAQLESLDSAED